MKFLSTIALILFPLTFFGQNSWKTHSFAEQKFEMDFFGELESSVDTLESGVVEYFWQTAPSDSLHPNSYYSVSLMIFPSDYIHSDSSTTLVEGFINSTQNSLTEDASFALLSSQLLEKDGYMAKKFKWKNTQLSNLLEIDVYLIENRLYQISVVTRPDLNHNNSIKTFFESFEMIDTPKGSYTLPDLSFEAYLSVDFPGKPKQEYRPSDTEAGRVVFDINLLEPARRDDNMVYMSSEAIYPSQVDTDNRFELQSFYHTVIMNSIQAMNGRLISLTDMMFDGHLGKELRCYMPNGQAVFVYRYLYLEERLYTVGVASAPDLVDNKKMLKFLNSFSVKKK